MIDEHMLRKIVKEASRETVRETLTGLGFNIDKPHETQADFLYLNKIRKGSEFLSLRMKATFIAFMIPTLLYLIWEAVKNSVQK